MFKELFTEAARGNMHRPDYTIMNARGVYSGKVSKVIPELDNSVILIGTLGDKKIAIIGSSSGIKKGQSGLDFYDVPKDGKIEFNYQIDTGNGYREPRSELTLTDYIFVGKGEALSEYKDASYSWYVFK